MNALTVNTINKQIVDTKKLSEMSDAELVVCCQQGSERAFEHLMKRHHRLISSAFGKYAPDWNDTADLTQEVFVRIWTGISKLQNPKAFKSWAMQIVTHLFYDELRKAHRRSPAFSLDQAIADDEEGPSREIEDVRPGPAELVERKDTLKIVDNAVQTLPEQFRTAIMLRDLEDMTYDDIAKMTQTDIGTVKSRISRARQKVQKVLTPAFGKVDKISA